MLPGIPFEFKPECKPATLDPAGMSLSLGHDGCRTQRTAADCKANNNALLQAVSSGAYSLSALLVGGALESAAAVGEFNPGSGASVTASQPPSIPNPIQGSGLTPFEGLLIFAPVILYGLFSVYRSQVNPRAKVNTLCPYQKLLQHCIRHIDIVDRLPDRLT